jgi:hypothetical protein
VQVHDAFLVLQPPVSTSASVCSPQCACKASALQTACLNAPSKMERAVIAWLRSMHSDSPSLSDQVFTISHQFYTISILLSRSVHFYVHEETSFASCLGGFLLWLTSCSFAATCFCYSALVPLSSSPFTAGLLLKGITFAIGLDRLQCCHQPPGACLTAAPAGCRAPLCFLVRQRGSCAWQTVTTGT